jgi:hypothetical protein
MIYNKLGQLSCLNIELLPTIDSPCILCRLTIRLKFYILSWGSGRLFKKRRNILDIIFIIYSCTRLITRLCPRGIYLFWDSLLWTQISFAHCSWKEHEQTRLHGPEPCYCSLIPATGNCAMRYQIRIILALDFPCEFILLHIYCENFERWNVETWVFNRILSEVLRLIRRYGLRCLSALLFNFRVSSRRTTVSS